MTSATADSRAAAPLAHARTFEVGMIVRSSLGKSLRRLVRDCFIILGVIVFLFCALNVLALPLVHPTIFNTDDIFENVVQPETPTGVKIYERIFKTADPTEAMARLKVSPNFAMHPTLEFITEPVNNKFFHIGLEGIATNHNGTTAKSHHFFVAERR